MVGCGLMIFEELYSSNLIQIPFLVQIPLQWGMDYDRLESRFPRTKGWQW